MLFIDFVVGLVTMCTTAFQVAVVIIIIIIIIIMQDKKLVKCLSYVVRHFNTLTPQIITVRFCSVLFLHFQI